MFLKKVLLLTRRFQQNFSQKKYLGALSSFARNEERHGILSSDSNDVVIPSTSVTEILFEKFESFRNHKAIECTISGKYYTYAELRSKSRNLSRFLRKKLKLQRGDVVAIVLANRSECAVAALGILEGAMTVTSVNPLYTTAEISKHLSSSSAKAVITQLSIYATVQSAIRSKQDVSGIPVILVKDNQSDSIHRGTIDFDEVINSTIDGSDIAPAHSDDIAFLPFSSGTTGLPKSIQLTNGNLVAATYQQCHPDMDFSDPPSNNHQEIITAALPFFHIYGFCTVLLQSLARGFKLITQPKFIPDKYVELLKDHKVTFLPLTPPLALFITSNPKIKSEYLKHLKYIMCGAAPIGEQDEERFLDKAGRHLRIYQGYGMSEACLVSTTATKQLHNTKAGGSVGKLVPNTTAKVISVDDPRGSPLGPNEVGELVIKGPQVMKGYGNSPEQNSNAFLDGWLRTGDLVYYDERGCIFIKDRLKEVIKVKGYQVAPAELEEIIRNFPAVEDAGVIGIPHPIFGEVPKAYVVQKSNVVLDTRKLEDYVNTNVIKYKRLLGGVEVIDAIPKNVSGKILRRELKQKFLSRI